MSSAPSSLNLPLLNALTEPALLVSSAAVVLAVNLPAANLMGIELSDAEHAPLSQFFTEPPEQLTRFLSACSRTSGAMPGALSFRRQTATGRYRCTGSLVSRSETVGQPNVILLRWHGGPNRPSLFVDLNKKLAEVQGALRELTQTNQTLEARVEERTELLTQANLELRLRRESAERMLQTLKETQSELFEISRLAGMAEVANGVLHNVGNILTSVNTSVSMLRRNITTSRGPGLNKAAELMSAQGDRLGTFVAEDARGQRLAGYLGKLAAQLDGERASALAELGCLEKSVTAIKRIIAIQQSCARVSGVKEAITPGALLEDVLSMHRTSLSKHDIRIKRTFEELPATLMERSKVMQIVHNLVSNAIDAMAEHPASGGHTLGLSALREGEMLRFSVSDTGVGIPEENLICIFNHGFTTKENGHGFGLHHSANAAAELAGRVEVSSAGAGSGAAFHLLIPADVTTGAATGARTPGDKV